MEPDRVSSQELLRDELDYLRNNAFHQVVFQMINTFLALFFFFKHFLKQKLTLFSTQLFAVVLGLARRERQHRSWELQGGQELLFSVPAFHTMAMDLWLADLHQPGEKGLQLRTHRFPL